MLKIRSTAIWLLVVATAVELVGLILGHALPSATWPAQLSTSTVEYSAGIVAVAALAVLLWCRSRTVRAPASAQTSGHQPVELMQTVLRTSHEWLWAVDPEGIFTFSSRTSLDFLGYQPDELHGRPISTVIGGVDLEHAREVRRSQGDTPVFTNLPAACRHKDGHIVWLEVSGVAHYDASGELTGYDGTIRAASSGTVESAELEQTRTRVTTMLANRLLITAFQPIFAAADGALLGVEALTRFLDDRGSGPEEWFRDAQSVGLGTELELLAVQAALERAVELPEDCYLSVNVSPLTCFAPCLSEMLDAAAIPADRVVLEITEHSSVTDYPALLAALRRLRERGVRIAVDDAGAGYASGRHIIQLLPDIIKIDRSIVGGIENDPARRALTAAVAHIANELKATLVAEGVETAAELAAIAALGVHAAQGYLLGRPTVNPTNWRRIAAVARLTHPLPRTTPNATPGH
jgi:PAS domain S-box-containing protein